MKKILEKIKKAFETKTLAVILYTVGIALAAVIIFSAGVITGFQKASFSKDWGGHYFENFGGKRHDGFEGIRTNNFPNANGAVGKIIKIELPIIDILGKDGIEKSVLLVRDTKIKNGQAESKDTDLTINDFVVVIGSPNAQGQTEAKFIRLFR